MDEVPGPSPRRSDRVTTPANYNGPPETPRPNNGRNNMWDISELLDRRIIRKEGTGFGELQYLIRWLGREPSEDQWEPVKNIADIRLVQTFERRLEQEGPSFLPHNRGHEKWKPLSKAWKAELRRMAREGNQLDFDSDESTEEEDDDFISPPPAPEVDVGIADDEIMAPEEQLEAAQGEEEEQDEDVEIIEDDEVIELDDSDPEWEDHAHLLSPPPPPPPPTRTPSPFKCLMVADSTEEPEPRCRPDSPDFFSGYIPHLLRGREPPPVLAPTASPEVPATNPAVQTAGIVEQPAASTSLPAMPATGQPSIPANPADPSAVTAEATTLQPTSAAPSTLHTIQPAPPTTHSTLPAATPKNPPNQPAAKNLVVARFKRAQKHKAGIRRNRLPVLGKRTGNKRYRKMSLNECVKRTRNALVASTQPHSSASSDLQQSSCNPVAGSSASSVLQQSSCNPVAGSSAFSTLQQSSHSSVAHSSAFFGLQKSSHNHVTHSSAFFGLQQSTHSSVAGSSASSDLQQGSHSMAHSSASTGNVDLALPVANNQLANPLQPIPPPIPELPLPHVFQPNTPLPNFPLPEYNALAPLGLPPYLPFQLPLPVNNAAFQPAFGFQMNPPAFHPMLAALAQALAFNLPPPMNIEDGGGLVFNPFYRRADRDGTRNSGTNMEQWSKNKEYME